MPDSTEGEGGRAVVWAGRRGGARAAGALALVLLSASGATVADDDAAFASIEASVSRQGTRATFLDTFGSLARDGATGALLLRTPAGLPRANDCRWPDPDTLAAIVPVATDHGSHASGVVFGRDRVLTAAHAVADSERLFVRVGGGYRVARLVMMDRAFDLAVLDVATDGIDPLPISRREPGDRQPVWAVGFAREAGRTTTSGVFQRHRQGALHTSAPIDPGQSGGGLLACDRGAFRVLGMLRGFGAYREGSRYVKLANHSVSVAGATIHRVLAGVR